MTRLATEPYVNSAIGAVAVDSIIQTLAPNSHWKLDEKTGLFLDSGSSEHDATYVSGARNLRGHRAGSKAVWDAVDAAIASVGDVYRFDGRQPFTVLGLHYWTGGGSANNAVLDKRDSGVTNGWVLGYSGGNAWMNRVSGASVVGGAARQNEWNLLIGVYDGNNLGVYINGQYTSVADVANLVSSVTALQINGFPGGGTFGAHGRYDTCAIWDGVALTEAQMDNIWEAV